MVSAEDRTQGWGEQTSRVNSYTSNSLMLNSPRTGLELLLGK